jgi:hypothetical protein
MVPIACFAVMTKNTSLVWLFFIIAHVIVFVDLVKQATHFWMLFHTIFKVYMVAIIAEIKGGLVSGSSTRDVTVSVLSKMQANEGTKVLEYDNICQPV